MPRPGWALFLTSAYKVNIWLNSVSDMLIMSRFRWVLILTSAYKVKFWMNSVSDLLIKIWTDINSYLFLYGQDLDERCFRPAYNVKIQMGINSDLCL